MNSFDIVLSIVGIISFFLFVIFYKRLRPTRFFGGKIHPADVWAMWQVVFAGPRTAELIRRWIHGNQVDFSPLLSIVVLVTTGIIMLILGRRAKSSTLDKSLLEDIDKQVTKLGKKQGKD